MKKPDEYEILERAHEAAGAHMMQKSPRADELIACLEGEIAKRDETIARLEPQLNRAIQANYDLREELAACRVAVENCEVFRARIVELESRYQRDVYGLNNEGDPIGGDPAGGYANDNARLRAELAAIKAKSVMPDVNLAAKALCSRHAAICGVDEDDQWKEYGQDFIADAETVLANSRLCAATVLEVNAHCAVIPEPYGWVAAGSFYTDRESAICAAEKTPCIDVYSRPQMNALENRSLQRQELAEELERQLNASCAEIRNMRNLYAAPVSEAKAQGVVILDESQEAAEFESQFQGCKAFMRDSNASEAAGKYVCQRSHMFKVWMHFRAMLAAPAAPAAPAADAGHVLYGMDGNHQGNQHMTIQDLREFYTLETLAARLNRSVVGVRTRLRASGRIPHGQYAHAKGSPLMFPVAEIEALIERDPGLVLPAGKDSD